MLKLVDIKKDYIMKDQENVHALKGVSLNFRRNEFVAILGPSGCGKTTLLNIVGGLDRYSSGDLVIQGVSTKNYKDRDWDTYRNHSVGFVFQAYNLIAHQNVLANVELALTISGISKSERKRRAMEAIEKVGLKGSEKKKPNQMSGGQMQRVAIARALVNNPEILLADEPTGALDSETSVQIMDLLKEVAQDRLVIMVTHNPELAMKYATRIVSMKDGLLLSDTNPYDGESAAERETQKAKLVESKGNKKRTSMSFATATGLSFANLISKLRRSILVTIAGSIGIIGVASVLSVSQGVSNYIDNMQDDMLSAYPLSISETSVDYASLMSGLSGFQASEAINWTLKNQVGVDSMIDYLMNKYQDFTSVKTNEINDDLLAYVEAMPEEALSALSYDYGLDMTNNVFTSFKRNDASEPSMMSMNGITQMYIAELKTVDGFAQYAMFVDLFTNFMNQLPGEEEYILSQYDLVGENSRFATGADELMLVVDDNQTLTDILLAQMGFFQEDEFLNLAKYAIEENKENPNQELLDKYDYPKSFTYDQILGKEMMYYPHDSIWEYKNVVRQNVKFTISIDTGEESTKYTFDLLYNSATDTLEGSVLMGEQTIPGITFSRNGVKDSSNPVLGNWTGTGLVQMFSLNLAIDTSYNNVATLYMTTMYEGTPITIPLPSVSYTYSNKDISGYRYSASADSATGGMPVKIVGILKAKEDTNFGSLSRGVYYTKALTAKMIEDSISSQIISNPSHGLEAYIGSDAEADGHYKAYVTYNYTSWANGDDAAIYDLPGESEALNGGSIMSAMFGGGNGNNSDTDRAYLRSLAGLASKLQNDETYKFVDVPQKISIYPKSFKAKDQITDYLDKWNKAGDIEVNGHVLTLEEREELTYVDTIEMIITVIDTMINAITIALVAFSSLSLVVSCFMIAVITYISTMERVKEIGVIRSLGGRKKDVSRLFIAECLMTGLFSGVFGIAITAVLCLILNIIVAPMGVFGIASLTPTIIIVMIALSIVLNVLSGLIPSMKASNQDPVIALRSE